MPFQGASPIGLVGASTLGVCNPQEPKYEQGPSSPDLHSALTPILRAPTPQPPPLLSLTTGFFPVLLPMGMNLSDSLPILAIFIPTIDLLFHS